MGGGFSGGGGGELIYLGGRESQTAGFEPERKPLKGF